MTARLTSAELEATVDDIYRQLRAEVIAPAIAELGRLRDPDTDLEYLVDALDGLDALFARFRSDVADHRARLLAGAVAGSSTRQVATALGCSPTAVAKAVARARALQPPSPPAPWFEGQLIPALEAFDAGATDAHLRE